MLVVEDTPHLDVDVIADVETMRKKPLWWKLPEGESLKERLNARMDRKKIQKRVPKTSRK